MTTVCRLVPTPLIAALRIAASGSPPSPLRLPNPLPEDATRPGVGRSRPSSPRAGRCRPGPAESKAVFEHTRSVGMYHPAGLGYLYLHLHIFCAFRFERFLQVLENRVTDQTCPVLHPLAPTGVSPAPALHRSQTKQGLFDFLVKHSFIKRTSAVYELPFVQITSVIQRYMTQAMHNSRLGGRKGTLPLGLRI